MTRYFRGRHAVAARRWILIFLITAAFFFMVACSSSSSSSSSQAAQAAVSIALKPAPSSTSVAVGSTTGIQFTPVVSNDPTNAGVDWAVTCSLSSTAGACGTLSISTLHSASGTTVSYIPPTNLQTGSLVVNVTAFATADHTKNVTTAVTVSSYATVLHGNYVLQVTGSDTNPYQATGVFFFDGKGNITSGQETINSSVSGFFSSSYTVQGSSGTPSTYFLGSDGRGTITLNLQQINGANAPKQTFTLVVNSAAKAFIAELDSSSASGTLELQDGAAAGTMPTGAYAFVTNGSDSGTFTSPITGSNFLPTAIGGVFNIDNNPSPGSISGNGSLADQDYFNSAGTRSALESCVPPAGVTGSVSAPNSLGVVTIALTGATCFGLNEPRSIQFTGYIVDATHIRLIESDDINGSGGFLTAGLAISQGSAAGTFTAASLTGPYVFGVLGYDINAFSPSSFTSAGVVNPDASTGRLSGITDTFFPGDFAAFAANGLTGTYAVDSTLIGRAELKPTFIGPSPKPLAHILFYLTGNGTPALVLWSEGEDPNFPAIGAGIAYPQTANAGTLSFGNPEKYGLRFTQNSGGTEIDGSGQMTSTISGVTGKLTGTEDDLNDTLLSGGTPFALSDSFTLPADSFGRISGTFMNLSGGSGPFVEYYLVNDNQGFFVEKDLLNTGIVSLGYIAQACDVTSATSCQMAAGSSSGRYATKGRAAHPVRGVR
jgi:hypothetical protein